MRGRVLLVACVVAVLAAGVAAYLLWPRPTPLESAVAQLPDTTVRASFTDWAAIADAIPGADPTAASSPEEITAFLDAAFDKDLAGTSSLGTSFEALAANYGVTPLDGEWEIYGQSEEGSVAVLQLRDDVDLDDLEGRFESLGYQAPADGAGSSGVWEGTPELVVGLDVPLSPLQQHVAVVEDERLLLMSDRAEFLETAVTVADGDGETLSDVDGMSELTSVAESPAVAVIWAGDFACEDLAMSQADPADQADADELVTAAGGVHPLSGLVMAQGASGGLTVGMVLDSDDAASEDLQPRTDLASGPAPGQGGTFPERFTVESAEADGRVVTMSFDPVEGPVLSDIGQGPVLFATC